MKAVQCPVSGSWRKIIAGRMFEATHTDPAPTVIPLALRAGLAKLAALLNATFRDPNTVLGLGRIQEFLQANRTDSRRRFCVLVAEQNDTLVGGTIFSYVARPNCGFSEYIVADAANRGVGLGRRGARS
jgi:hypothetical protein